MYELCRSSTRGSRLWSRKREEELLEQSRRTRWSRSRSTRSQEQEDEEEQPQ